MDRFIDEVDTDEIEKRVDLKSNMDRFIEVEAQFYGNLSPDLKSNMDRFIAVLELPTKVQTKI